MGWIAAAVQGVSAISSIWEGQEEKKRQMQLGGEQASYYQKFGEYNARNIEAQGAEEDRRMFVNNEITNSMAQARAAASGFKLSGTPQDYIDRMRTIQADTMNWHRKTVAASASQTREEATIRAGFALRYGAMAGEVSADRGNAAALNSISTGIGTFARLYNPATEA